MKRIEALREIDRKIIDTNNRKEIFDTILTLTGQNLRHKGRGKVQGTILLYDRLENALIVKSHPGPDEKIRLKKKIQLSQKKGLTYHAFTGQQSVRVGDVKKDSRYLRIDEKTLSELDAPIIEDNESLGVIGFESNRSNFFTENDEEFLATIANQVLVAIKKTGAYENELKAKDNELAIASVAQKIIEDHLNINEVINLVMRKALELTQSKAGAILMHDKVQKDFFIAAGQNIKAEMRSERLPDTKGLAGLAIREKSTLNVDVRKSPYKDIHVPWIRGVEWALVVPMQGKKKVPIGVMAIEGKRQFSAQDQQLIEELAALAVIAIENARRHEEAVNTLKTLNDVGRRLTEIVDPGSLDDAYEMISKILQTEPEVQVVIRRFDIETQKLNKVWQAKETPSAFDSIGIDEHRVIKTAFDKRLTIPIPDRKNPPRGFRRLKYSDPDANSLVIAWMVSGDKIYGSVALTHPKSNFFLDIHLKLIEGLAQLLALTFARLNEEEENLSFAVAGPMGVLARDLVHDIAGELNGMLNSYDHEFKPGKPHTKETIFHFLKGMIEDISKVSKKGSGFLRALGGFSTNGEEEKEKEKELIDAIVLIQSIKHDLEERLEKNLKTTGIRLNWKIPKKLPNVSVVRGHIFGIIQNLVNNAIDAMKNKAGEIKISVTKTDNIIRISVADEGPGFPPDQKEKMFKQGHSTKGSSGYGLWSALLSAKLHGGRIHAENLKKGGAVFTLTVPISKT